MQTSSGGSEATVCCGGIIAVIVVVILIGYSAGKAQAKALAEAQARKAQILAEARATYHDFLTKLKADPTNSNLRETTLHFGREYSNLTRNNQGVTIFDEVALSNDINAACGGATKIAENKQIAQPQTIESRLQKLTELKNIGLISEEEYAARRQKILDEV